MADFRLGRLKFNWRGVWQASTAYVIDDIVNFGGKTYTCVVNHTSTSSQTTWYSTDFNIGTPKWQLHVAGFDYLGAWQTNTFYSLNDIVTLGSTVYICIADHTSAANQNLFETSDVGYWDIYTSGLRNRGNWATSTFYKIDDTAKYGANVYRCTNDHTSSNNQNLFYSTDLGNWILLVEGVTFRNDWVAATWYRLNDVIRYGNNLYLCTAGHTATSTFDPTKFVDYLQAIKFEDAWSSAGEYQIGDIVTYGGYAYVALTIHTNKQPNLFLNVDWKVITTGFKAQGNWSAGTYKQGDVVIYGGDTYVAETTTTQNPSNTAVWSRITEGMYFANNWSSNTNYQRHDVVRRGSSSYISMRFDNANNDPTTANSTTWQILAQGDSNNLLTSNGDLLYYSSSGVARFPIGANNELLVANTTGFPQWKPNFADHVYYVTKNGNNVNDGKSLQAAYGTLRYAIDNSPNNATIYVKSGTYNEELPIKVKTGQQIIGDGLRTTIIQPANGFASNTMFMVGDSTLIKNISMRGMTGFAANTGATPEDITVAANNTTGIFIAFDPDQPILTKSPYIADCSAFSNNGIGVIVDGSLHASGSRTMVFHAFTNVHDGGVGFWIKDQAGAEIVSCFTYYAHIGYTATGGGKIRALNGNNSYGKYGIVSSGFDSTETPNAGTIYGDQITLKPAFSGGFTVGATVTGVTSGAIGVITNAQLSANKVYIKKTSGTFVQDENITVSDGSTGSLVNNSDFYTGQKGFVLVLTGLSAIPRVGGSISLTGDSFSYVIQSVSGTYVNSSSVIVVVLAGEKPSASVDGTALSIRYKYSQVRLTGHDFLSIGTGGKVTTNYPGEPTIPPTQGNEVIETFPGRAFYVSTDQDGNFRVGEYFRIDQATGRATLNASAFDLSGLSSLRLGSIGAQLGEQINEFSADGTLGGNSNQAVPTEFAVKSYVDGRISSNTTTIAANSATQAPLMSAVKTYVDSGLTARVPQALPTSVGQTGKYLVSNGASVEWAPVSTDVLVGLSTLAVRSTFSGTFTYSVFSGTLLQPYTFSLSGTVPSGVSINSSTGVLTSNTSTAVGVYSFNVNAAGSSGTGTVTKVVQLTVSTAVPVFSTQNLPGSVQLSAAFSSTATQAAAGSGTTVHTLTAGALPTWATLSSAGVLSGTVPASPSGAFSGPFTFTVTATNGAFVVNKSFTWTFYLGLVQGQNAYTSPGTYSWTAPTAVTEVSVVAIGGGGAGQDGWANPGGGGGGLGWKNNIPVVPGTAYTVVVGSGGTSTSTSGAAQLRGGTSYFIDTSTVAGFGGGNASGGSAAAIGPNVNGQGGGFVGDGGGAGGNTTSWTGGAGAGGYYGRGGNNSESWNWPTVRGAYGGSYYSSTYGTGSGGGIGLGGDTTNSTTGWPSPGNAFYNPFTGYTNNPNLGSGGSGAFSGNNGMYGENPFTSTGQSSDNLQGGSYGGGGGGPGTSWPNASGNGGSGALRIIWGPGRAYPGTSTADVTPGGPA
jgi:hypothetical protein